MLVCPACHAPLAREELTLRCSGCGRSYPIREGIPTLVSDQSVPPERDGVKAGP